MGKILDFLTPEWVERRLVAAKAPRVSPGAEPAEGFIQLALRMAVQAAPPETDLAALEAQIRRDAAAQARLRAERERDPEHRLSCLVMDCIGICECEYASGSAPRVIREHCRLAAERALPLLGSLDYSIKHCRIEEGLLPSSARSLAEKYGGTWWKARDQSAGVEYSYANQPLNQPDRLDLWFIAAVSGDPDLARSVATAYQARPPSETDPDEALDSILRCALAGDTEGEEALAARLKPGYPADFPPKFIELPLGVIRRDPGMILEGVRKLGTRFKRKWDPKTHRAWYDKRQPRTPGRRHPNGTWEQYLETAKSHLFGLHWIFSWWTISWLQVARQRGLTELFEPRHRKVFSEWVASAMAQSD